MTRHAYIYDLRSSTRYVLVRGRVSHLLEGAGVPATYSRTAQGWHVRKERAADVRAMCEAVGMIVHSVGGDPR